jgi:hypothetical protein
MGSLYPQETRALQGFRRPLSSSNMSRSSCAVYFLPKQQHVISTKNTTRTFPLCLVWQSSLPLSAHLLSWMLIVCVSMRSMRSMRGGFICMHVIVVLLYVLLISVTFIFFCCIHTCADIIHMYTYI